MKIYKVHDKEYRVICSVHNEISRIVGTLEIDKNTKEYILELISVANDMAVNMENALERKRDFGIGLFGFEDKDEE